MESWQLWLMLGGIIYFLLVVIGWSFLEAATKAGCGFCFVCRKVLYTSLSDHYLLSPECEAKRLGRAS